MWSRGDPVPAAWDVDTGEYSVQHVPDAIQHQGMLAKTPQLRVRPLTAYGELHTSYCFYGNLTVLVQKRDSEYFSTVIP